MVSAALFMVVTCRKTLAVTLTYACLHAWQTREGKQAVWRTLQVEPWLQHRNRKIFLNSIKLPLRFTEGAETRLQIVPTPRLCANYKWWWQLHQTQWNSTPVFIQPVQGHSEPTGCERPGTPGTDWRSRVTRLTQRQTNHFSLVSLLIKYITNFCLNDLHCRAVLYSSDVSEVI